jgi:GT2 family glycosyltransferase
MINFLTTRSPQEKEESMPQSDAVLVSVVVPCRNEIRHIHAFLDSVFRQELGCIEMEVLVADGMSDDGTRQALGEFERRFASLRVLENPEQIVSTALNRAIREARGEIIIRMDAHSIYAPDYVRCCVEVLHETNADNVAGPALTRADGYKAQAIAHAFHTPFARGGARFRNPRYEGAVDTVPYGCWRKATLERTGMFDEKQIRSEDYEFNLRIISRGGTVWQSPKITSWYWPRASLSRLFWQYLQYGFWKAGVFRKYPRVTSWRNLVPGTCLFVGVVLLFGAAAASFAGSVRWRELFLASWLALAGSYLIASFAAAFSVAKREGWNFLPILPVVFATYHLSYALGSLLAILYSPATLDLPNPMRRVLSAINR